MKKIMKIISLIIVLVSIMTQVVNAEIYLPIEEIIVDENVSSGEVVEEEKKSEVNNSSIRKSKSSSSDGWVKKNDGWYYYSNGALIINAFVDGNDYYVGDKGKMVTGWKMINNKWYMFGSDGKMLKNQKYRDNNGHTYYLRSDGVMENNQATIDGKTYYFLSSGEMLLDANGNPKPRNSSVGDSDSSIVKKNSSSGEGATQQQVNVAIAETQGYVRNVSNPLVPTMENGELTILQEPINNTYIETIMSKIRWVDDSRKKKTAIPREEDIVRAREVLKMMPNGVLAKMIGIVENIYVCLYDEDGYVMTRTYKDREDGSSNKVELPYQYTRGNIVICDAIDNLAHGIGAFINEEYRYQNNKPYLSGYWKSWVNSSEESEFCMGIDNGATRVYGEENQIYFETAFGMYILNNLVMEEECPKLCRFLKGVINNIEVKPG